MNRHFAGYVFDRVAEIYPIADNTGKLLEYSHQLPPDVRPNRYAAGPFCQFQLVGLPTISGVYAITVADELKYIGECVDLSTRFGTGQYAYIAERNCHSDGQATNCKLNALILSSAKVGDVITLWFHPTHSHKAVEKTLISKLVLPWNGRRNAVLATAQGGKYMKKRPNIKSSALAEVFQHHLEQQFETASAQGKSHATICAGDLHMMVGGYPGSNHRMPVCCRVMKSLMTPTDIILKAPPKGAGASLTIEYRLPTD